MPPEFRGHRFFNYRRIYSNHLLFSFADLLVSFADLLVNAADLLVSFALSLVNSTLLLVSFAVFSEHAWQTSRWVK
ncbi:hypothetical protein PSKAS_32950 [Peribacillus sp. N1]